MTKAKHVRVRRVYEAARPREDGLRVLVDRVWPRGMKKEDARLDEWAKQVAPSTELRKWYSHDPERYGEFAQRYRAELAEPEAGEALDRLRERIDGGTVTLLTAVKDDQLDHSHAAVLREELGGGR
ncbi:DUF488 family protein [Streptomyces sp. HNM0575]|uniref:DUF488 domain-containing protein n=1 Tax=Streptomyces sp. HNM0575 TaxID=2716338 RepID=UPI00145F0FF6|nr:DUF488 family protein [Streptomyces sp. HNM0575]NLU75146.1 DUF488 family protein [Streptomyces sp. HNM0575]